MPQISFYGVESDVSLLLDILNKDEKIAFFVKDGAKGDRACWKAVRELDQLPSMLSVWFICDARLPLLWYEHRFLAYIDDPWQGWCEARIGLEKSSPYWGPISFPSIFELTNQCFLKDNRIQLSCFEWGNTKGIVDEFTEKEIKKWWTALERKLAKVSTKVSRVPGGKPNAYCLPGAYELSLLGVTRNINP